MVRSTSVLRIFARKSSGTSMRRAISRKGTTRSIGCEARKIMARIPYSILREIWNGCCCIAVVAGESQVYPTSYGS
jgi:hypothetical protein